MNRIIRNLVIAVPLATVGLTAVNTGAAIAGPNGPNIIVQPTQDPEPHPGPKFDNDLPLADAPKPKAPKPQPKPKPKPAQPTAGNQSFVPAANTTEPTKKKAHKKVVSAKGSPDSIDRSDNLFVAGPAETTLESTTDDNGLDMTWLLLGGGVVTATGIAFAARKRSNA